MKNQHLLEDIKYIPPGPITAAFLATVGNHKRYIDLSSFKRISTVVDGVESLQCGWCNAEKVRGKVRKYCGDYCRESAYMYCYPTAPQTKAWVFINKQSCTCLRCGEIFEDDIDKIIEDKLLYNNQMADKYGHIYGWKKDELVNYWQVGKKIGHLFDADHIVALCNGGRGIGLENIQIICRTCHHKKTAQDIKTSKE